MRQLEDLTGQKFDGFEVIARNGSDSRRNTLWKCKCNYCGTVHEQVRRDYAIRKATANEPAGCELCKWQRQSQPLVGTKSGSLTALSVAGSYGFVAVLLDVQCECGSTFKVRSSHFKNNKCSCHACGKGR